MSGTVGDNIFRASGVIAAAASGDAVDWQTGAIKTASFTAADSEGYFINTTSGVVTMNLPAASAGNIVACVDYANTADTNNITISANGSEKIQGSTDDHIIEVEGGSITLVYVDATQGWKLVDTGTGTDLPQIANFTTATGGTITCSGDYKIHTFTSPGTFCVSVLGNAASNPAGGPNAASYMVLAGGGGTKPLGGGGGAGGYREGRVTAPEYTASPLVAPAGGLTITASPYPITVGAGGVATVPATPVAMTAGGSSIFSTITSAGGAIPAGGSAIPTPPVADGGSGGGGGHRSVSGGVGNTPPVSPPQGNPGGGGASPVPFPVAFSASGGGGAGGAGVASPPGPGPGGPGGIGTTTSIDGTPTIRAGGGAGGGYNTGGGTGGPGGGGNGGSAPPGISGTDGTQYLGAGGGGGGEGAPSGGAGGSGAVIIRYKFQ